MKLASQYPIPDIELLARQAVEGFVIGLHKSPYHGFSIEFAEHRPYNTGDSLRHLDWKVYGRSDRMFIKKYEEETNLRCCIAIDTSASMQYRNAAGRSKLEASAIGAATLIAFLKKQMDASGLAIFDQSLRRLSRMGSSTAHHKSLLSLLQQELLLPSAAAAKGSHIGQVLHQLADRLHRRSLIILFSDLDEEPMDVQALIAALQHLRHAKHEVLIFEVGDGAKEWELALPDRPLALRDLETGETMNIIPREVRQAYLQSYGSFRAHFQHQCRLMNIDLFHYDINEDPAILLRRYLIKRKKMGG